MEGGKKEHWKAYKAIDSIMFCNPGKKTKKKKKTLKMKEIQKIFICITR